MRHKAIFLWGPIVFVGLLLGSLGLLRVYLAEAAGVLVEELTGAGAEIESMDVAWLPPHVTVHGLRVDTGSERITAPRIELYPNLSNILDGEVTLDKAILDQPILQSVLRRKSAGEALVHSFDPAMLPERISIRNAAFVVDDDGVESKPVTFSADVQKASGGLVLSVKSMTIPEFGLEFSGLVDVTSTAPLKLSIDARKGVFDPSELLGFLHRFEYLGPDQLAMFTRTKTVSAENFVMDFDADTKAIALKAGTFTLDASSFSEFAVKAAPDSGWSIACTEGKVDSAQMLALTKAHPDGAKAVAEGLDGMGLKSLEMAGGVMLKNVSLQSRAGGKPTGSLSLTTPSFKVDMVSAKDEEQTITLNNLDGEVTFKNGKPTVKVNRLELASSAGGEASVSGEAAIPFSLAGTRFLAEARQFNWYGTRFDGSASKKNAHQIALDFLVHGPSATIKAKGLARKEFTGRNTWSAVLDDLIIKTEDAVPADGAAGEAVIAAKEAALDEPFDFEFVKDGTLSGKIAVRRLQYNDLPVMRDMSARIQSIRGRTIVRGRGRLCLMKVEVESVLAPDEVAVKTMVRGTGVHFPGVLGCFVNELPVYLRGRLTAQADFLMHGKTVRQVKDSVVGDVVMRLSQLKVLKMSNLDKRLGFFLEIINAVDVGPDEEDSVSFKNALVTARVKKGVFELPTVRLTGRRLSLEGSGRLDMKEKRLQLDAYVTTPFGISKDITVDSSMAEERS